MEQVERQVICMRLPGARWPLFGWSFITVLFVAFDVLSEQTGNGVSNSLQATYIQYRLYDFVILERNRFISSILVHFNLLDFVF